ncbi:MAG: carbohydrate-binding domain-containing protein [Oscillospiraceae bacterium]|jgi:hypothetical protein|nr:carbohydrate-binding domain-containing protein [Oscillospiraceae bacterium]
MAFINKRAFTITISLAAAMLVAIAAFTGAGYGESVAASQTLSEPDDYFAPLYSFAPEDYESSIPSSATLIDMTDSGVNITGLGAAADESTILIHLPGTYVFTGESSGRQVLIDAKKSDVIRIALNNASIINEGAAAIYARKAGKVAIVLPEGTSSKIVGGVADTVDSDDDDVKSVQAAVYIKDDLAITGGGELTIESPGRGVWAKDMLIVTGGKLYVESGGFALRGTDGVAMRGAVMSIMSGGDGIKATKEDDPAKGFVQLEDCALDITAYNDGVQAESSLIIVSGEYVIHAGGGADAVELSSARMGGGRAGFIQPVVETDSDSDSMKGLKAGTTLHVRGGGFTLDTQDDSVHSDGDVWISGGTLTIRTGDDGVHAESLLRVDDGSINITRCFEGLEASAIEINGGEHTITATDDAVNLADGSASKGGWGMTGRGGSSASSMTMYINGGIIRASGGADTIDANGDIVMSGGELYLSGMSLGMDGAIDFDGTFTIDGGRLATAGSVLSVSPESGQSTLLIRYAQSVDAGSVIELRGEDGEALLSLVSETACTVSGFSAPELSPGQTVSIWINDEPRAEVTLSEDEPVTSVSEDGGAYGTFNGGRMGFGGFGTQGQPPAMPDGQFPADGQFPRDGQLPPDGQFPRDGQLPPDGQLPRDGQRPQGGQRGGWSGQSPEPTVEPDASPDP